MVFLDDDRVNREWVRLHAPSVVVPELPADPALYIQALAGVRDFDRLQITDEDRLRGVSYAVEKQRLDLRQAGGTLEEFFASLQMTTDVLEGDAYALPRIAQLAQKTNQFNTTTIRYTLEELTELGQSHEYLIKCFQAKDRFGDYGIIGAYVVNKNDGDWRIESFMMSCRAIGKGIEFKVMDYLIREAERAGARKVIGIFIPTKKNEPAKSFFAQCQFSLREQVSVEEAWEYIIKV